MIISRRNGMRRSDFGKCWRVTGQLWNIFKITDRLGVSAPTAKFCLDTLEYTLMIRQFLSAQAVTRVLVWHRGYQTQCSLCGLSGEGTLCTWQRR